MAMRKKTTNRTGFRNGTEKLPSRSEDDIMNFENLNILYEDNHLIVVIKPENILSQKDDTGDSDMMTIIKEYLKEKYHKPGEAFLGLVHRLDRRVAGVMVYAKTSKAASRLSEQIRTHSIGKEYTAAVIGSAPDHGTLRDYIVKGTEDGKITAKLSEPGNGDAKEAVLEFTKIREKNIGQMIVSVLSIHLITGRYQQIRLQLSHYGYPIINDFKYGYRGNPIGDTLGLACTKLIFSHPTTKETLTFEYHPDHGIWGLL